ncbi:MAG TPA: PAS domain-containing sensor histidine kinase [Acidimicrobiales bacterium]|nr:PAS domain-containing sensor histidine kinase [Acidimicrobiales bacterium]
MSAGDLLSNESVAATQVAAAAAIAILDEHGRIHVSHAAVQAMFGYTSDELSLRSFDDLLVDDRRSKEPAELCRVMHADGRTFLVEVTSSPVALPGALRSVVVVVDRSALELELLFETTFEAVPHGLAIVDRREVIVRANAELADTVGKSPEALRGTRLDASSKVEFIQIASHDLKSPLRGVSDLIEWISEELGDDTSESVANNLDRIRSRLVRMDVLIDQLLAYARVGRSVESNRLIHITDLVNDALGLVNVPDEFTVTVHVDGAPFVGSPTPLETVLRNLLSSAVKHHDRPDGALIVRARAVGEACRIEVIDDGPEVPVTDHARIFRLFQTATARPSENGCLGLAVCRRLCENARRDHRDRCHTRTRIDLPRRMAARCSRRRVCRLR